MPIYTVNRGFCLHAGRDVYPGEQVEIAEHIAKPYVVLGKLTLCEHPATATAIDNDPKPTTISPAKRTRVVEASKEVG